MKGVVEYMKYKIDLRFGGLAAVIQALLLVLRFTNIIDWTWYFVMAPILIFLGIASLVLIIFGIMLIINNRNRF